MHETAAAICVMILTVAAGFHIYWGFAGRVGIGVSVPLRDDGSPAINPGPLAMIGVGLVLIAVICLILTIFGFLHFPVPEVLIRVGAMIWAAIFFARAVSWHRFIGLFKSVRRTRFAIYDTWIYSPLCLIVAAGMTFGLIV